MKQYIAIKENKKGNTHIMVETRYSKGKGYYISVRPVKIERGCYSYECFTDVSGWLKKVSRKSKKSEAEAEAMAENVMMDYVGRVCKEQGYELAG